MTDMICPLPIQHVQHISTTIDSTMHVQWGNMYITMISRMSRHIRMNPKYVVFTEGWPVCESISFKIILTDFV